MRTCKCGANNKHILDRIVPARHNFDLRVVITIGLLRWIMDYQREEIQVLMESRGISISTGEISILSEQFLLSFYALHKRHVADLCGAFVQYILHLDGTGEAGKEIVFAAKEGASGITIDAVGMPSESIEYIVPFLKSIKEAFGRISPL